MRSRTRSSPGRRRTTSTASSSTCATTAAATTRTLRPPLATLRDPAIDRPGRLYVLIGRITFSAAANFATDLEQKTGAMFVGEAMGGSPNLYGDARPIACRTAPGPIYHVRRRYWEKSTADDPRITIEPDDPPSSDSPSDRSTSRGRDPVLEARVSCPW